MEADIIKGTWGLLSLLLGAFGLQRYIRSDYEKKLFEFKKYLQRFDHYFDEQREALHKLEIKQAKLISESHFLKEHIQTISQKLERLS